MHVPRTACICLRWGKALASRTCASVTFPLPKRSNRKHHPAAAPGTDTLSGPFSGKNSRSGAAPAASLPPAVAAATAASPPIRAPPPGAAAPAARSSTSCFIWSYDSVLDARPDELMPCSLPVLGSQTIAIKSPPKPHIMGSTTPSMALAAIAASTALPPSFRMSSAACVLSGCDVAAMPRCARIGLRVANGRPVGREPPQLSSSGTTDGMVDTQHVGWSTKAGREDDEAG